MITQLKFLLLFQFLFFNVSGQLPYTKSFSHRDGFCSTTIMLDSLGNFYHESGCEGRSYISLGSYKLIGDIIHFTFQKFDSSPPILNIAEHTSSNNAFITVTLLTRQGKPLSNDNFTIDVIDTSGRFFKTLELGNNGEIKIDAEKYKEIRFDYLENLYFRKVRIPIKNKDLTVILNLPQLFFNYFRRPIPEFGTNFSLMLKKNGLYDIAGKEKEYNLNE